ncbi:class I SAM-dependent methyltransferase [Nostoc sp.]|uniref:class I SAM-dependent methyltransferase n=1 Tax=Nostoc sp. TaxID=1180 RepID=UPI002FFAA0A7
MRIPNHVQLTDAKQKADLSYILSYDKLIFNSVSRSIYQNSDFFNAGDWSQGKSNLPEASRAMIRRHLNLSPLTRTNNLPLHILDVGCGLGAGTEMIAQHYPNAEVLGINISPMQVAYARKHHPAATYQVMDATNITLPGEHFDQIISIEAACHFSSRTAFLKSAYRTLKSGGSLILADVLFKENKWNDDWLIPKTSKIINLSDYQQMFQQVGFIVNVIEDITEITWLSLCNYLRDVCGMSELAENLRNSVIAYVSVCVSKP